MKCKQNNTKSICLIAPFMGPLLSGKGTGCGGAERQLYLIGNELKTRGWKVSVIIDDKAVYGESRMEIFRTRFSVLKKSRNVFSDFVSLWKAMNRAKAEIYLLRTPGLYAFVIALYCKTHRKKFVFWAQAMKDCHKGFREGVNKVAMLLQDMGVKRADIIIAQTLVQKRAFENHLKRKAIIMPNIYDRLNNVKEDKEKEVVDVLWCGNSGKIKRQELFFMIAELLPEYKFAFISNGKGTPRYEKARRMSGEHKNIIFIGEVSPYEAEKWFERTKVLLSTSKSEGFPNTFLQAWANGIPVISIGLDFDGVIQKYGLGEVVKSLSEDEKDIAADTAGVIAGLLESPSKLDKIKKAAVNYVVREHNIKTIIDKVEAILIEN